MQIPQVIPTPTPTDIPSPTPTNTPSPTPLITPTPTPTPDTVPPTVNITNPVNNSSVPKNSVVTINATASDTSDIAKVEFYVNNALTCTDTTSPYSCSFTTSVKKGTVYTLIAKAFDRANNSNSSTVKVTTQ